MRFSQIKIIADENISPRIVCWFRKNGFDILDVKEENWQGFSDEFIKNGD